MTQYPLSPGDRLDHYQLVAEIGAGGMGVVYEALDSRLDRKVAIKVLPPAFATEPARVSRFEREARTVASLSHPNVVALYDVGRVGEVSYVVMELLEGETLRDRIRGGAIPARKAMEIASQVARGLAAAHERGVIHRDIKPDNIFLTQASHAKILDFGLARQVVGSIAEKQTTTSPVTEPGVLVGTVGYMAPEQVRGEPVQAATDIFALGLVLFEMLTGQRAFQGPTKVEVMASILDQDPTSACGLVPTLPPSLDRVVGRCLEKRMEDRFRSARSVAYALEAVFDSSIRSGHQASLIEPPRRRRRWIPALLALVVVLSWATSRAMGPPPLPQVAVSFQRLGVGGIASENARFAPDGETIVFSAGGELFSARPRESREARSLGIEGYIDDITANGTLTVMRDFDGIRGSVYSVPLAGGEPRLLAHNVSQARWLDEEETLAIVPATGSPLRHTIELPPGNVIYRIPRTDDPREEVQGFYDLEISPDGSFLAMQEIFSVAIINRSGEQLVDLSFDIGELNFGVEWGPDGSEVWFSRREGATTRIEAVDLEGRRRLLLSLPGEFRLTAVAPDGRAILKGASGSTHLRGRLPGQEREFERPLPHGSILLDLSPDGQSFLLSDVAWDQVELRDVGNPTGTNLGEGFRSSISDDGMAVAVKAGSEFVVHDRESGESQGISVALENFLFSSAPHLLRGGRRLLFSHRMKPGPSTTYLFDIDSKNLEVLHEDARLDYGIRPLSPNQRDYFAVALEGSKRWRLYSIEGTEARDLRDLEAEDRLVRWTEDGSSIFVWRLMAEEERGVFYKYHVATGDLTKWREVELPSLLPRYDTIFPLISADGEWYLYHFRRDHDELFIVEGLH